MGIPEIELNSGYKMPVIALGTASYVTPKPEEVQAILHAIERGYRHFDTAAHYGSEEAVGEAVAEALKRGLIKSRSELFIVSKTWCSDNHTDRVVPALNKTLQNVKLEYLDLYLIHWPVSLKPETGLEYPVVDKKDIVPFDCKAVWSGMEECVKLGLAKSIGVSNFSCKKIQDLLAFATIPPAVNQVELSPAWQQKRLVDLCKANGIVVTGYSPLRSGGQVWGTDRIVGINPALKDIAEAKGKSVPQVILRWIHQYGAAPVVKSYNPGRMEENRNIFDWELSEEDCKKISEIPQSRGMKGEGYVGEEGAIKSLEELWDGEL